MAIDTKMTDELLLATLIAQNGRDQGQIVYNQTKSCGLVNWNPATNGEAAREQARHQEMLSRPSSSVDTRSFSEQVSDEGFFVPLLCRTCEYGAVLLLFGVPLALLCGSIGTNLMKLIQLYF